MLTAVTKKARPTVRAYDRGSLPADFAAQRCPTGLYARYCSLNIVYTPPHLAKFAFPSRKVPTYWWRSQDHKRAYMEHIKGQLGGNLTDLYKIRKSHLVSSGGSSLLADNSWSPSQAVMSTFPEHDWKPWKFHRSPNNWWKRTGVKLAAGDEKALETVGAYLAELAQDLRLSSPQEWKTVAVSKLDRATQAQLEHLGGLKFAVGKVFPDTAGDLASAPKGPGAAKFADQTHLQDSVDTLLPKST